jgi:rod shape determining protein RodA
LQLAQVAFLARAGFKGTQAHLEFIPEKHTDFVFAVFSEEFGLLGNFVLIALFFALIKRGLTDASAELTTSFICLLVLR